MTIVTQSSALGKSLKVDGSKLQARLLFPKWEVCDLQAHTGFELGRLPSNTLKDKLICNERLLVKLLRQNHEVKGCIENKSKARKLWKSKTEFGCSLL